MVGIMKPHQARGLPLMLLLVCLGIPCVAQDRHKNQIVHIVDGQVQEVFYLKQSEDVTNRSGESVKRGGSSRISIERDEPQPDSVAHESRLTGKAKYDAEAGARAELAISGELKSGKSQAEGSVLIAELLKRASQNQVNSVINGNMTAVARRRSKTASQKNKPVIPGYAYEELKQLTQESQKAVQDLVEALNKHSSPP